MQLPERFIRAQASRAKLNDISGGGVHIVTVSEEPAELLKQTFDDIQNATFVGKGDKETVQQTLAVFEWDMKMAAEQATEHTAESDLTVDPAVMRKLKRETRRRKLDERSTRRVKVRFVPNL